MLLLYRTFISSDLCLSVDAVSSTGVICLFIVLHCMSGFCACALSLPLHKWMNACSSWADNFGRDESIVRRQSKHYCSACCGGKFDYCDDCCHIGHYYTSLSTTATFVTATTEVISCIFTTVKDIKLLLFSFVYLLKYKQDWTKCDRTLFIALEKRISFGTRSGRLRIIQKGTGCNLLYTKTYRLTTETITFSLVGDT